MRGVGWKKGAERGRGCAGARALWAQKGRGSLPRSGVGKLHLLAGDLAVYRLGSVLGRGGSYGCKTQGTARCETEGAGEARTFAKGRRAFNLRRQPKGGRVPARALGRFRFGFWKKAGRRRGKGYSGPATSAGAETEVWRVWAGPLSDAKGGGEEDTRVKVVRGGGRGRQGGKEWA